MTAGDLVDRFRHWAERAGATVELVSDQTSATAAVQSLAERIQSRRITATRNAAPFAPAGALVGGSVAEVADAELGISLARLAVAETGSVLLGSNVPEDRLVGMLSRTHAVIVSTNRLVASLDDAAPELRRLTAPGTDQVRYLGFVTGPSRTADIERVLTIGVQGPRALHVILVEA